MKPETVEQVIKDLKWAHANGMLYEYISTFLNGLETTDVQVLHNSWAALYEWDL